MKILAKIAAAFAVLALAAPALACDGMKTKTASKGEAKPAVASATTSGKASAPVEKPAEAKTTAAVAN
jgi:hypothetical protein